MVMDALLGFIERTSPKGAFVGLMAAEGVAGLYERYGLSGDPMTRPACGARSEPQARGEFGSTRRSAKLEELLPNSHQPSIHGFT